MASDSFSQVASVTNASQDADTIEINLNNLVDWLWEKPQNWEAIRAKILEQIKESKAEDSIYILLKLANETGISLPEGGITSSRREVKNFYNNSLSYLERSLSYEDILTHDPNCLGDEPEPVAA